MSTIERYLWKVYCLGPPAHYETVISETEPTVCPVGGGPIDPQETLKLGALFIDLVTEGYMNLESQLADNQALKIIASNPNGGIVMSSGFGGINVLTTNSISLNGAAASNFTTTNGNLVLNAVAGLTNIDGGSGINLGNDAASTPILIGTSNNLKHVSIGSINTTSSTSINSGTGGLLLGNNNSGGEVHIASNANAKTIYIGNNTSGTRIFTRTGGSGDIRSQPAAIFLADSNLTFAGWYLLSAILSGTPTADRTYTLPSAAEMVATIPGVIAGDSIDFSIINKSSSADQAIMSLNANTGVTIDGNGQIHPRQNAAGTYYTSGSGLFRLVFTEVTSGSEAYTLYRLA